MKIEVKQDPRFKYRLSLRFGVVELTEEEYIERRGNLLRNACVFVFTTAAGILLSSVLN